MTESSNSSWFLQMEALLALFLDAVIFTFSLERCLKSSSQSASIDLKGTHIDDQPSGKEGMEGRADTKLLAERDPV